MEYILMQTAMNNSYHEYPKRLSLFLIVRIQTAQNAKGFGKNHQISHPLVSNKLLQTRLVLTLPNQKKNL